MLVKNQVKAIPLTSIATGSVSGSYAAINSSGLPFPCFALRIINNTDKDVTVSYDGTTDNDYIPTLSSLTISTQTNSQPNGYIALFKVGTVVYVKGTAGMSGSIYLAGYYQPAGV